MPFRPAAQETSPGNGRALREACVAYVGDDEALVEALRERKPAAIVAFHDRYASYVLRILVRILGHDVDLEDVHHEAFVRALGSIEQLREPSRLTSWMTSVAVLTARTCIQRRQRKRWLVFVAPSDLPQGESSNGDSCSEMVEALRATYRLLERMPTDERILFALRYIEGLELTELAVAVSTSLATVKRRLARAEKRFVALARLDPELCEWVERGGRWNAI